MKSCKSIADCSEEKKILFFKKKFAIKECKSCTLQFCLPETVETHFSNVYSDNYFFEGKDGYPNYLDEKEILIKYGNWYAKIISNYTRLPGTLLDVGCAAGFILKGFEQQGWNCYGIEPNKTMVEYGTKELDLNIQVGNLESIAIDKKFDLITFIQVIGHFHDIDKAIKNAFFLLKPGGHILVESWNRNSIVAKMLGKYWHEYSPPSVTHWFSDRTLINLFKQYGFKFIDKGLPMKKIKLKHAISLIDSKLPNFYPKQKIVKLLNQSLGKLNLVYPPMDIKWYVFQKDDFQMLYE